MFQGEDAGGANALHTTLSPHYGHCHSPEWPSGLIFPLRAMQEQNPGSDSGS